jgi:hypothetical protein
MSTSLSTALNRGVATALGCLLLALPAAAATAGDAATCPQVYLRDTLRLPFNPAFLHVAEFPGERAAARPALLLSSFYNVVKDPAGRRVERFIERDLAAWIPDLDAVDRRGFEAARDLEVLTDRGAAAPLTVWPNETDRVPSGVLPFEAVVVPGGFLSADKPGRFTLIDVSDPARREYVVAEAGTATPDCRDGVVRNEQWYYHQALFHDMDGDGLQDIITARASFKPFLHRCPPVGELVWFRNPGAALDPAQPWDVQVLIGLPDELNGPEINLDLADLDADGVPEIIATHFFTSDQITIVGAPAGRPWRALRDDPQLRPRRQVVMSGQGRPFAVEAIDLDMDGRLEILTSNHQGDGCFDVTRDAIPGRVVALVPPADGRIFDSAWSAQVLKDDIRPHPTLPAPARGPGRLAPNRAIAFWPQRSMEGRERPWIVVGGDEASKVWVLRPLAPRARGDWRYASHVIFDINEHYGPGTTQTLLRDPQGVSISTIGGISWRYDRPGPRGRAVIYAPVFEAREIQVLSFRPDRGRRVGCGPDVVTACPAPQ